MIKLILLIAQSILNFDQRVLDVLESLCHRQQRFFGVTHYFWLKLDAVILAALFGAYLYPNEPIQERWKTILLICALLAAASFGFAIWERKSFQRIAKGLANPLRKETWMIIFRLGSFYPSTMLILLAGLSVPSFASFVTSLAWIMFAMLYLLPACDLLPPSTGKVKVWLNQLVRRRSLA